MNDKKKKQKHVADGIEKWMLETGIRKDECDKHSDFELKLEELLKERMNYGVTNYKKCSNCRFSSENDQDKYLCTVNPGFTIFVEPDGLCDFHPLLKDRKV